MIFTDLQKEITEKNLSELERYIHEISSSNDPHVAILKDAIDSQICELKSQIQEYEDSKKYEIDSVNKLSDLPEALIKRRISSGISIEEISREVGISPRKFSQMEESFYKGVSISLQSKVAAVLGLRIEGSSAVDWSAFPIKEMIRRGWFIRKDSNPINDVIRYIEKFIDIDFAQAFYHKSKFNKKEASHYDLIAWQARVVEKALKIIEEREGISDFQYDDRWISDLVKLSAIDNGPLLAKEYLYEKGIVLVIEEHLPKTYLDGSVMLLDSGNPIIALTLRLNRLDNFWFVLLHEIGHLFLHVMTSSLTQVVDEDIERSSSKIEDEANEFSRNYLIPDSDWRNCASRFLTKDSAVIADAKRLNISPSIVAGRIRREKNNYKILSNLVGNGVVKNLFEM